MPFAAPGSEHAAPSPLPPSAMELPGSGGMGRNLEAIAPMCLSIGNNVPSSFPLRKHNPRE